MNTDTLKEITADLLHRRLHMPRRLADWTADRFTLAELRAAQYAYRCDSAIGTRHLARLVRQAKDRCGRTRKKARKKSAQLLLF